MPPYSGMGIAHDRGFPLSSRKALSLDAIGSSKRCLVSLVRSYAEEQKELWQKVPWLALQANGRDGYSDHYSIAYGSGMWSVGPEGSNYTDFVDCATGKLVDGELRDLSEARVLALASRMEELDAEAIINNLLDEGRKGRPSYCSVEEWESTERWRKAKAIERGLEEIYKRVHPPTWSFSIS